MGVRHCGELGVILQLIVKRLLANQTLCKLLLYSDQDPLSHPDIPDTSILYGKQIKMIPKQFPVETDQCTIIPLVHYAHKAGNDEFADICVKVYIYIPQTAWIIKSDNLRPFALIEQVENSLSNKVINGLGTLKNTSIILSDVTEQMTCYSIEYHITAFA